MKKKNGRRPPLQSFSLDGNWGNNGVGMKGEVDKNKQGIMLLEVYVLSCYQYNWRC